MGAAGLLSWGSSRARAASGLLLVAVLGGLVFAFGRDNPPALPLRPSQAAISFYAELAATGNEGPVFEEPSPGEQGQLSWNSTAAQLLLSAWHHRPTSACYSSHAPPSRGQMEAVASMPPSRAMVRELAALGFTTVVVRHMPHHSASWKITPSAQRVPLLRRFIPWRMFALA